MFEPQAEGDQVDWNFRKPKRLGIQRPGPLYTHGYLFLDNTGYALFKRAI